MGGNALENSTQWVEDGYKFTYKSYHCQFIRRPLNAVCGSIFCNERDVIGVSSHKETEVGFEGVA